MMISGKLTLKGFIALAGVALVLSVPLSASAEAESGNDKAQRVDLVWAASDGLRHELYNATRLGGKWSEPQKITNDNADNLHPCLDTGSDGKKWLVWTAIEQGGYEIRYAVEVGEKWSDPQTLPSGLSSNIAPTVIVDDADVPWIVWSGNDGISNDEIYYTRFIDGKWQKPNLVNKTNDIPDILPVIAITDQGKPQVTWDGYREDNYTKLRAIWTGKGWGPEEVVDTETVKTTEKEVANNKQVDFPDFVEDTRQAFFRIYSVD